MCCQISQPKITGMAKNERKNTASPGGTCGADALMQIAIIVKTSTERTLRPMPRSGFMGRLAGVAAGGTRARDNGGNGVAHKGSGCRGRGP